jgi:hypothetical protein
MPETQADATPAEGEALLRRFLGQDHLRLGDNLRDQAISFYERGRFAEAQVK